LALLGICLKGLFSNELASNESVLMQFRKNSLFLKMYKSTVLILIERTDAGYKNKPWGSEIQLYLSLEGKSKSCGYAAWNRSL